MVARARRRVRAGELHGQLGESGLASLEIALIVPILALIVLGLTQFALWYHAEQVVIAAAQEGAAQASTRSGTPAAGQDRAEAVLSGLAPMTTATQIDVGGGSGVVTVSITSSLHALIPGITTLPLHATATSHIEQAP